MDEALEFQSATGDWVGFEGRTRGNVFGEWQKVVVGIRVERDGRGIDHVNNPILFRSDAEGNIIGRMGIDAVHRREPGVILCDGVIVSLAFVSLVPAFTFPTFFRVTFILACYGNARKQEFFFIFSVCACECSRYLVVILCLKNGGTRKTG